MQLPIATSHPVPRNPWILCLSWVALCCALFFKPLLALVNYSLANESASHIPVIPFIVAALLFLDRRKLPTAPEPDFSAAVPFAFTAAFVTAFAVWNSSRAAMQGGPTLLTIAWILFLISGFIAIFGRTAARSVWFALAFLGFAIPLPEGLLDWIIYLLQSGSAAVAGWIFDLSGVANWREGFVFHLAGWNIEVARECSGIRSSIALVIVAVLVAHFSFTKFWKKAVFVAAGLAVMIVKNGVRIAALSLLAKYVDPNFLFGRLHHEGGFVFFLLGLALLLPVYLLLRRRDPIAAPPSRHEVVI